MSRYPAYAWQYCAFTQRETFAECRGCITAEQRRAATQALSATKIARYTKYKNWIRMETKTGTGCKCENYEKMSMHGVNRSSCELTGDWGTDWNNPLHEWNNGIEASLVLVKCKDRNTSR